MNEKPVKQSVLDTLPDTKIHINHHNQNNEEEKKGVSGNEEYNKCSVCMTEYNEGETVKTLPCFHKYHKECIEGWFKVQNFCPICKFELK